MKILKHLIELLVYLIPILIFLYFWNTGLGVSIFTHSDGPTQEMMMIGTSIAGSIIIFLTVFSISYKKKLIMHSRSHYEVEIIGKGVFSKIIPIRNNHYYSTNYVKGLTGEDVWEDEEGTHYLSANWLNSELAKIRTRDRRINST